jgi:hypothetical protein
MLVFHDEMISTKLGSSPKCFTHLEFHVLGIKEMGLHGLQYNSCHNFLMRYSKQTLTIVPLNEHIAWAHLSII